METKAPPGFKESLETYSMKVSKANSEAAKAFLFLEFLRKAFNRLEVDYAETLDPVLEKSLKHVARKGDRTIMVRGRVDAFLGNLIIEFKKSLNDRSLSEAASEIRRYVSILWSKQPEHRTRYLGMATDGERFVAFRPRAPVANKELLPDDVVLDRVDFAELTTLKAGEAFVWLDRYTLTRSLSPVTTEAFAKEFGLNKPGHRDAETFLKAAWKKRKEEVLYGQWASFLHIVYGSAVENEELFIRHSYLSVLAKLLAYSSISGGVLPVSTEQISEVLEGTIFEKWNVHNFLEEDFFSWVARSDEGISAARALLDRLSSYDLTTIDEDVLKSLYQELVDPQSRHDLGEYYTPDWLAEIMVEKAIAGEAGKTMLDPSCGSGTFLAAAIRFKKKLIDKLPLDEQLQTILNSVRGVDVHPLAVTLARTNYLISLGSELLSARKGGIFLPVYLADSIRIPDTSTDYYAGVECFKIDAEKKVLRLPISLAKSSNIADAVIEIVKEYSHELARGAAPDATQLEVMLKQRLNVAPPELNAGAIGVLLETAFTMSRLIREGKDTIWSFILKNIYKPLFLKDNRSDIVIGNPPWISYRYIESQDYQKFLKKLIVEDYKLLPPNKGELITQLELASLFMSRTMDLYLKDNGLISFVMPRSLFVADQHQNFRKGAILPRMEFIEFFDLEGVEPLFKIPSCVVMAARGSTEFPVKTTVFEGHLKSRNERKEDALAVLTRWVENLACYQIGDRSLLGDEKLRPIMAAIGRGRRSSYYKTFTQGATIVPRPFWFVEPVVHPKLGIDTTRPHLRSSTRAVEWAKDEYQSIVFDEEVESRFLFHVVTGSEIVPFATKSLPIAVIPVVPADGEFSIIKAEDANRNGWNGLSLWLRKAETIWNEKRGDKAKMMNIYQRLDYTHGLTSQSSRSKYKVIYNTSGTFLASSVISNAPSTVRAGSATIRASGVIADTTTYYFDTDEFDEAYFVATVLNAPIVDKLIKPMQARGLWGERHIHKKVLELPIPKFDKTNDAHSELVRIGKFCKQRSETVVETLSSKYSGIGTLRQAVKKEISEELTHIDSIVRDLLGDMGSISSSLENYGQNQE